jgi:hypothetical protein
MAPLSASKGLLTHQPLLAVRQIPAEPAVRFLAGRDGAPPLTHIGRLPFDPLALTRDKASQNSRAGGQAGLLRSFALRLSLCHPSPCPKTGLLPLLKTTPFTAQPNTGQAYGTQPRGTGQPPGRRRQDFHLLTAGKP